MASMIFWLRRFAGWIPKYVEEMRCSSLGVGIS
jgi:hypothetical protein